MRGRHVTGCLVLGWLLVAAPAAAQAPADGLAAAWTERARNLYNEGRNLYAAREWERAHAAFAAAWGVKKHWQIGAMLGHCEMMLGRHRDAAEHFAWALRSGGRAPGMEEIDAMQVGLERARARVAAMLVQVDEPGAQVLVDGELVGTSPLADPVFMEPGRHRFEARVSGRAPVHTSLQLAEGSSQLMVLSFASGVAEVTRAGPQASPQRADRSGGPSARLVTLIAGAGVSALALGVGVGYSLKKSDANSDADASLANLTQRYGATPCYQPQAAAAECARLADARERADDAGKVATGAFITFGVAGALTAATAASYLVWPSRKHGDAAGQVSLVAVPGGLVLTGGF
jgi:hypothetical protein